MNKPKTVQSLASKPYSEGGGDYVTVSPKKPIDLDRYLSKGVN